MKLPVKPKDDRDIINEDGFVCFANTMATRDHIVKVINCHEKLMELLRYAHNLPMNEAGDYEENIKWQKETEQALKEAEES